MRLSTKEDLAARILAKVLVINPFRMYLSPVASFLEITTLHYLPNLLDAASFSFLRRPLLILPYPSSSAFRGLTFPYRHLHVEVRRTRRRYLNIQRSPTPP